MRWLTRKVNFSVDLPGVNKKASLSSDVSVGISGRGRFIVLETTQQIIAGLRQLPQLHTLETGNGIRTR